MEDLKVCDIENCGRKRKAKGLCTAHYKRFTGESKIPMEAPVRDTSSKKHLPCNQPGCPDFQYCKGYCSVHYARKYITRSDMDAPRKRFYREDETCTVRSCVRHPRASGLCTLHYQRSNKGTPMDAPHRESRPGEWGVWRAHRKTGYVFRTRTLDKKREHQMQHRYVMEKYIGRELEPHETVHHLNGDRADNRIENLELWSRSQPYGQRVKDKVEWAREILNRYEPILYLLE